MNTFKNEGTEAPGVDRGLNAQRKKEKSNSNYNTSPHTGTHNHIKKNHPYLNTAAFSSTSSLSLHHSKHHGG